MPGEIAKKSRILPALGFNLKQFCSRLHTGAFSALGQIIEHPYLMCLKQIDLKGKNHPRCSIAFHQNDFVKSNLKIHTYARFASYSLIISLVSELQLQSTKLKREENNRKCV